MKTIKDAKKEFVKELKLLRDITAHLDLCTNLI